MRKITLDNIFSFPPLYCKCVSFLISQATQFLFSWKVSLSEVLISLSKTIQILLLVASPSICFTVYHTLLVCGLMSAKKTQNNNIYASFKSILHSYVAMLSTAASSDLRGNGPAPILTYDVAHTLLIFESYKPI